MAGMSRLNVALLAALAQAGEPRHAAALLPDVEGRLGARMNRGALARALGELRDAGLVLAKEGRPAPNGGPARILYRISKAGRDRLDEEVRAFGLLTAQRALSPAVQAHLRHPPPGSKVAEARDYGVDLTRLARVLLQSPLERYREAVAAMKAFRRYAP